MPDLLAIVVSAGLRCSLDRASLESFPREIAACDDDPRPRHLWSGFRIFLTSNYIICTIVQFLAMGGFNRPPAIGRPDPANGRTSRT